MKNLKKITWFIVLMILFGYKLIAQETTYSDEDFFSNTSFAYLENGSKNSMKEPKKAIKFAQKWINKARVEQNWKQAVNAYKTMMHLDQRKCLVLYSDSLLDVALKTKDNAILGSAYLTKGIIHYERKEINKALDYYLIADKYIAKTANEYEQNKIKYAIAQTKYYLGFYEEAIALLKECILYFEDENDRGYLNTLHSLGLCYNKQGKYHLTSYYNDLGIQECKTLEIEEMELYFRLSEAINEYGKNEYEVAITKLKELLPIFQQKLDSSATTTIYFYMGKSYWSTKKRKQAVFYFLQVDKVLDVKNVIRPELRENYELLISWYKQQNDLPLQLSYINKLIEVDKVLTKNYKYLSHRIFKEYDTKELIQEKVAIEAAMKSKNKIHYTLFILLAGALIVVVVNQYRNKKKYEKKFNEVMQNPVIKRTTNTINNEELDISHEVIAIVLKNLDKFEKNKKYLEKDMNLVKLATLLNTNTKYASKIIAKHRGKGTIDYITDLKLEYIIALLKTDKKFRNYTNQALGEEAGFGSTQNFTRAFKNRTDISPTYFIQKLNQQETT